MVSLYQTQTEAKTFSTEIQVIKKKKKELFGHTQGKTLRRSPLGNKRIKQTDWISEGIISKEPIPILRQSNSTCWRQAPTNSSTELKKTTVGLDQLFPLKMYTKRTHSYLSRSTCYSVLYSFLWQP